MKTENLIVELLVEELPPRALKKLGDAFASQLFEQLKALGLTRADSQLSTYATPRRLAAHITLVSGKADDKPQRNRLMPVKVGLDADGQPTPALLKRLAALGLDASAVPQLVQAPDGKSDFLFHDSVAAGATLAEGLQKALDEAIAKLPIPRVMTYQLHRDTALPGWDNVQFVRPAHGLLALHGSDVVPVTALGLTAGRSTQGHRFEAELSPVEIAGADSYADTLEQQGAVIASFSQRRQSIEKQLQAAASQAGAGLMVARDDALLDEVTALVERPKVVVCAFEKEFLDVPQECLILTMKANQKYFPLLDAEGHLSHRFLVVSNISPDDPSAVIAGNERVVRPRLADAKFFFDQDRRTRLEDRLPGLAQVVYHNQLGTQAQRSERVRAIARRIGEQLGGQQLAGQAGQAAQLAKADLLTGMVGEFPELQGVMGGYYARHDGLSDDIAEAIEDHYKPRFAGDELPRGQVGTVVALADKLETLVGLFGIGQLPTGERDPFALRRHALGVIRMLVEQGLPLDLPDLLADAATAFGSLLADANGSNKKLLEFMHERLAGYLREHGASTQEADAVIAAGLHLSEMLKALDALHAFTRLPEAPALAAANKRIGNILKKADAGSGELQAALLQEPAEQALHQVMQTLVPRANAQFDGGDYTACLQTLAALREPVDAFFDGVMVNADDPALRANRLQLLCQLHEAMNRVARLSRLAA